MCKSARVLAPGWDWEAMSEDEKERIQQNINKIHEILDRMIARLDCSDASSVVASPASKLTPAALAASDGVLISVPPTMCSTVCPAPDTGATAPATRDADLISTSPARCSLDCPSHDTGTPTSTLTATTAPTTSTTTTDVSTEPDSNPDIVAIDTTSLAMATPTTCSMSGPDHSTGGVDPAAVSLVSWGAPTAVNAPSEASPTPPRWPFAVLGFDTLAPTRCLMKGYVEVTYKLKPAFTPGVSLGSTSTTNPRDDVNSYPAPTPRLPETTSIGFRTAQVWAWLLPAPSRPPDQLGVLQDWFPPPRTLPPLPKPPWLLHEHEALTWHVQYMAFLNLCLVSVGALHVFEELPTNNAKMVSQPLKRCFERNQWLTPTPDQGATRTCQLRPVPWLSFLLGRGHVQTPVSGPTSSRSGGIGCLHGTSEQNEQFSCVVASPIQAKLLSFFGPECLDFKDFMLHCTDNRLVSALVHVLIGLDCKPSQEGFSTGKKALVMLDRWRTR